MAQCRLSLRPDQAEAGILREILRVVLGKRNAGVELSTYPGVSALCVALRAQAMATWQSPHSRFRPGFPHAAALHPGQTNLARVGAALPFGVPFTGAAVQVLVQVPP